MAPLWSLDIHCSKPHGVSALSLPNVTCPHATFSAAHTAHTLSAPQALQLSNVTLSPRQSPAGAYRHELNLKLRNRVGPVAIALADEMWP